jgi:WD40 repeat protein/serine/threonine protein kinase
MKDISGQSVKGYELREMIGAGGFGAVYRAYQPLIKRDVAMKIILPDYANHPEFIRRFEFEAQLVARLEHIHIVALYDYWRDPQGAYLIMRWLRGGSLRSRLKQGPIDNDTAVRVVEQIASALAVAHRRGVVHRDIKPDNILFDEEGNAYLADFGIAKDVHEVTLDGEQTAEMDDEGLTGSPFYLAPEQARSLPVSSRTDIYSLGIVIYEMLTGQPPFKGDQGLMAILLQHINTPVPSALDLRPDLPPDVDPVIQRATAKDPDSRYADTLELSVAFRRAMLAQDEAERAAQPGAPALRDTSAMDEVLVITKPISPSTLIIVPSEQIANPYKGLQAFQEADAEDFFGRDLLIARLLDRLKEPDELSRFLAVIGPSGSGKSSVVKAGVIPALRRGALPDSDRWYMVEMVPGADPFRELVAALLAVASDAPESLLERLRSDVRGLRDAVETILPPGAECGLVLTIDQFEEVFTLVEDEAARVHFLNALQTAVTDPDCRFRLIITLRADFYDRPLLYPGFGELVRKRNEVVLPLSLDEMREAIIAPTERVGLSVESGLVAAIVAEIAEQPGALPLLQYALTELFERREANVLTLDAYHASGGVLGALARRAEELYQETSPEGQDAMRQVFLRLVTLGEGVEDTRRRADQAELMSVVADEALVTGLLDTLGRYRLVTFDHDPETRTPVVAVAHEALLREWERMRRWLDDSREDLLLQRKVAQANAEWREHGRDASYLAIGTRLQQFESLVSGGTIALTPEEVDYIRSSVAQREAREAEERARAEREAALEKRSRDRLRALAVVLAAGLVIAAVLAAVAFQQRQTAEDRRKEANAQRVIAERNAELSQSQALVSNAQTALKDDDTDLAIALALEANTIPNPPPEALQILEVAALSPGTVRVFEGHTAALRSVAISPDGQTALTGSEDMSLILWNLDTGAIIRRFEGHPAAVRHAVLSSDGALALSGAMDGEVILWDVASGAILHRLAGHQGPVFKVAFSPDNARAISVSVDNTAILWDVASGETLHRFAREFAEDQDPTQVAMLSVAFSPDGGSILIGSSDGNLALWDVETGEVIRTFGDLDQGISSVAFSADGATALSGGGDHIARLWDVAAGEQLLPFVGHGAWVKSVAFSLDGQFALTTSDDGSIRLWNLSTSEEVKRFVGHSGFVEQAVFSPDGRSLLSASGDGTMRLWTLINGAELRRYGGHMADVSSVDISPDGKRLLSGSYDATVRIGDRDSGESLLVFTGHQAPVMTAIFSPDGTQVLSGDPSALLLWDAETGEVAQTLQGLDTFAVCAAFSPDGSAALTGTADGKVVLWDLTAGAQTFSMEGHGDVVFSAAIAPDGRTGVTSARNGTVILWNLEDGSEILRFEGHTGAVTGVTFSPDGQYVLTASQDTLVILWDAATGQEIRRFEGHTAGANSAAFSPDGTMIISASDDGTLRVWDAATGQEIRRLDHGTAVSKVVFTPDGAEAVSGSPDTTVRLWDAAPLTLDRLEAWTRAHRYVAPLTCAQEVSYHLKEASECGGE